MNEHHKQEKRDDTERKRKVTFWQRSLSDLQRRFIAGIITLIPISITFVVVYVIIKQINRLFSPLVSNIFYLDIPILDRILPVAVSVILALGLIYLIGLLSATLAIRRLISFGEKILARIPFIKILYVTSKQIVDAVTLPHKGAFKKLVAIEYPRKGIYVLAFVTGESVNNQTGERLVSLFLPSTPNPTTGFLLLLPLNEVYDVDLGIDKGIKLIISGGILTPETLNIRPYPGYTESSISTHEEVIKDEIRKK